MDIRYYYNMIVKKIWLIFLLTLLVGALATAYNYKKFVPTYSASTTLLVMNNDEEDFSSYNNILVDQQLVKEYKEIIKSRMVALAAIDQLKSSNITYSDYMNGINVSLKADTRILVINAFNVNAEKAQLLANKASDVFIEKIVKLMKIKNIVVIDRAEKPTAPSKFNYKKHLLIGSLAGFLLAFLIIFLLNELDDTVKTAEEVEKMVGLKVLGNIPTLKLK